MHRWIRHIYKYMGEDAVDRSFCPVWFHSLSIPKKHVEAYINYKLVGLLAQAFY